MTVNDELLPLEMDLAKYPEGEEGSQINRRMILREALDKTDRAGWERGYSDGLRDDTEARSVEQQIRKTRGLGDLLSEVEVGEVDLLKATLETLAQSWRDQAIALIGKVPPGLVGVAEADLLNNCARMLEEAIAHGGQG